jgi:hypothetical protein
LLVSGKTLPATVSAGWSSFVIASLLDHEVAVQS